MGKHIRKVGESNGLSMVKVLSDRNSGTALTNTTVLPSDVRSALGNCGVDNRKR